jgi:Polysaccharide deacetylase
MFTPIGIGMHRNRLLAVAIFSLMAFCYEIVAAPELATEQPAISEATPTPSVAPSDAPQRSSYSSCRVDGPYIAMTFDDGPHPVLTPRLLDMLKARGIKATFFLIGQNAAEYPDIVRRIAAEGHEIGNHTWNILLVGVVALLAARFGLAWEGALAAWLIAIHPWHLRFTTEARGYALVALLILVSCLLAVNALDRGQWKWGFEEQRNRKPV